MGEPLLEAAACTRNLGLISEGRRLVELAAGHGIVARLLGGAAILIHCPDALALGGYREIGDVDLVVASGGERRLADLLVTEQYQPGYLDAMSPRVLLARKGDPRELAATVVWLASDAAGFVTGQTIVIDGGFTIS